LELQIAVLAQDQLPIASASVSALMVDGNPKNMDPAGAKPEM